MWGAGYSGAIIRPESSLLARADAENVDDANDHGHVDENVEDESDDDDNECDITADGRGDLHDNDDSDYDEEEHYDEIDDEEST